MIDLRSDTVTRPGADMRRAMYEAEVGDDVFGEDVTVLRLQEYVAELLGKEAALFVPSGVMANQIGLLVHTVPGTEVVMERGCHIFNYEGGSAAWLAGVQPHPVDGSDGILNADDVEAALRAGHYGQPATSLICLENTHNLAGGVPQTVAQLEQVTRVAGKHGLPVHLDGARLWNAAVALDTGVRAFADLFDTVSVCLSKGLGAPVGSLLAGSARHIEKAHHFRKRLGGGMRQVGILAAAGLFALEHHRDRLADDHTHAKQLARGLAELPLINVDPENVRTNIVYFDLEGERTTAEVLRSLEEEGIWMVPTGPRTIRAVTHLDVSRSDIDRTLHVLRSLCST